MAKFIEAFDTNDDLHLINVDHIARVQRLGARRTLIVVANGNPYSSSNNNKDIITQANYDDVKAKLVEGLR